MADSILYGLAGEILKKVGSSVLDEIASAYGFKSDLDKLKQSISTIEGVLLDAETKQADSHAVRVWLDGLSKVIYAADDLFDEFATVAARKQLIGGNKFTTEVHTFFSHYNQIAYSRKVKFIREKLDGIVKDGNDFGLARRSYEAGRVFARRRDQRYSYIEAEEVIGRDADKKAILDLLLASSDQEQEVLPVISIVGMGGLGKTTLAQLVYDDPQVKGLFDKRFWVCVSDVFDIKEITEKILKSATNSETPKLEMDQLQGGLRNAIGDSKYLLVLDDVWNENHEEWLKMRALLKIGKKGSKILVTTRLSRVGSIMSTFPPYDLQGLSEEKSWDLFERVAFAPGQAPQMPHLVSIGKEIVLKCGNVPLAIRSLGGVLYMQDESKWLSIRDTSLANIPVAGFNIMSILKISYYHLESPLKNCFAYCALFPKDYSVNKDILKYLWMAEGFIIPTADGRPSLEELGEDYFLTLLQWGFFQNVKEDQWGCIESCKMHDLIHDLAQEVSGVKCKVVTKTDESLQNDVYHLSFAYRLNFQRNIPSAMLNLKVPRTLLLPQQVSDGSTFSKLMCEQLISSFSCLRVLDLHGLGLSNIPTSIGKLIHLRYLDLSLNPFRALPDSITKLHNLQTLNLNHCSNLYTLPTKIKKLVNLRTLDISDCGLVFGHMPLGIGELTSLHKLPLFIVSNHSGSAVLSELRKLNNLRGKLCVAFEDHLKTTMLEAREGDLTCKQGLKELEISFAIGERDLFDDVNKVMVAPEAHSDHDEVVLEGLKPHRDLRRLSICNYKGRKLPNWTMMDSLVLHLSKVVQIELYEWNCCQLPTFSQLPLLKRFSLTRLLTVEYIEAENDLSDTKSPLFFPSLEILELHVIPNLKGWWKGGGASYESEFAQPSLPFPKLSNLNIHRCENLTSLPTCPNVERLHLLETTKNLSILKIVTDSSRLKEMTVGNVEDLLSIPTQCLLQLSCLCIKDPTLVSTDKLGDLFATLSSSIQSLSFHSCHNLISISRGLEHLTVLERLRIYYCNQLDLSNDMPWKAFKNSLRSLKLFRLAKLVSLPVGLQHLTNLRSLEILLNYNFTELPEWIGCFSSLEYLELYSCDKLASLPESLRKLTALHELQIVYCSKLIKRCRGPNGSDWPKIQHIPLVAVQDYGSVL